MRTRILTYILTVITALFLSACGDAHFKNEETKIAVIDCDTAVANIPDDYTTMNSGDVLVNEVANTVVTTYHDINGVKKVCTDSGKAHLVRQ